MATDRRAAAHTTHARTHAPKVTLGSLQKAPQVFLAQPHAVRDLLGRTTRHPRNTRHHRRRFLHFDLANCQVRSEMPLVVAVRVVCLATTPRPRRARSIETPARGFWCETTKKSHTTIDEHNCHHPLDSVCENRERREDGLDWRQHCLEDASATAQQPIG